VLVAFAVAFGSVFIAELPDKTMFATIVLATRYRRPWAVLIGVTLAMAVHAVLAVAVGSALRRLPDTPVQLAVAAMFLVGGLLMIFGGDDDDEADDVKPAATAGAVIAATAVIIGVAEFGDFTQLATIGVVAKYGYPVAVAVGSTVAHIAVAALAILTGGWLERRMPVRLIQRLGGALFIVFAIVTLASVVTS
jgi:putative Ca2+/H+ antiporter (TMEM165/GDT1 family)